MRRPFLQQPVTDCEQHRPEENADESERNDAAQYAQEHEDEWKIAAMTDDQRLQNIVDRRDDKRAPQQDKNPPSGFTAVDEPQCGGNPDERRPDGNWRQQKCCKTQKRSRLDAGNPEPDASENALNEGGTENPFLVQSQSTIDPAP